MKKISVITPVYNEEDTIEDVYLAIKKAFTESLKNYDYEHIFMDNASIDRSFELLKNIAASDPHVKVLSYSKNFGPIKTEMIGYRYASGDAVIHYDASLKDPPELILEFVKKWEEGYQVVYGVRVKTADNLILGLLRKIYYKALTSISEEYLPINAGSFRIVDRIVVNELIRLDDFKPYIRGLITSIGYKQIGIEYKRGPRQKGKSKSNINYLIDFAINAMLSYSIVPIRLCTYLGIVLAIFSFIAALVYLIMKFYYPAQIPAVAGVIFLFLIFTGIQLFFLGIIGEYVGAIHSQVRKKPFVVIREKINLP